MIPLFAVGPPGRTRAGIPSEADPMNITAASCTQTQLSRYATMLFICSVDRVAHKLISTYDKVELIGIFAFRASLGAIVAVEFPVLNTVYMLIPCPQIT